ncbi:MAG: hypothetical protein ACFE9R_01255 [Candidatus Hermodarchaeota archaeon]
MSESKDFSLDLQNSETILLQTKAIEDKKLGLLNKGVMIIFGIAGIILLLICFYYLIPDEEYPDQYLGFYGFLFFSLICFSTMIAGFLITYYNKNTTYYITTNRILRVRERYFSFRHPKIYEISFSNLSHLIVWDWGIEIIPKKSNGEIYYKGVETDFSHKKGGMKTIVIRLNGSKGKKLITKATENLTKEGPLRQHPNMDFLYINS